MSVSLRFLCSKARLYFELATSGGQIRTHVFLATVNIPQADRLVIRPTDKLPRIGRVEMDATDPKAAIVSNVSFTGNCSTPLPR